MASKARGASRLVLGLAMAAGLAACRGSGFEAPALADLPEVSSARVGPLEVTAPGYGITIRREGRLELEVSLEAEDAPSVREGQRCTAYVPPSTTTLACSVSRLLRSASAETGQAIAWLEPRASPGLPPAGEFVFAEITTQVKKALIVPSPAVLTKEGRSWVIRRRGEGAAAKFEPVEVKTGESSGGSTEIVSGLSPGDQVAVHGALGYLYPEFKAGASD